MLKEKIILDTDIGSDIDDAVCLAYLLAQPRCELMGITTVSGEAELRARMCSSICRVAGKDIPIFPGVEKPLLSGSFQPKAPQAEKLSHWPHAMEFPQGKAIEFLYNTICTNPGEITLLAIGPMTNIGILFAEHPDAAAKLKRLVLMCGRFITGEQGSLEWNALNDPHSTAIVYRTNTKIHRSYGLDVTTQLVLDAGVVRSRFTHPLLKPVLDYAEVWFESRPKITFHDPLAGLSIFDEVCEYACGQVKVDLFGETAGLTRFREKKDGPHEIASTVNSELFFDRFFKVMQS